MKKRWMVQAFALALTGALIFGTGSVTYADEKKPVVIGEMVGQESSDKDTTSKDASGKECDQCQDPVYTWTPTDSGYTCKAVRECKNTENAKKHYREEIAKVDSKITKQATCEEKGEIIYTATFENKTETDKKDDVKADDVKNADSKSGDTKKTDAKEAESGLFKTQTKTVEIPALGHKYGEVSYTWNQTDNGYSCTATRVCENDSNHVETETVDAAVEVTKAPTCEEKGEEVYTAVFANEAFEAQTKTVETDALGHRFIDVSYEWTKTDDGYTCTATAVCDVDPSHTATETVTATAEVTKAATCEAKGEETYTAVFENAGFETQTKAEEIAALGHKYGDVTYKWTKTDDGYTCTATRICENDNTHVEKEAATATSKVTKAASCEGKGEEVYTASFKNAAFEAQTKTVETDALGHKYGGASYKWTKEDKGYSCTATRVCQNDKNHVEKETVTASYKVTTKATSDKAGEGLYTAAFKNAAFEEQTKKVTISATGKKDDKKNTTTKKNTTKKSTTKKTATKTNTKTTAKKSTAVKTGDETKPLVMGVVAIGALAVIVVAGRQLRKKH